jgi:hypothetical protein
MGKLFKSLLLWNQSANSLKVAILDEVRVTRNNFEN